MRKVWAIVKENMEIGQNSSFMAVKCQNTRNGKGGAVTIVP